VTAPISRTLDVTGPLTSYLRETRELTEAAGAAMRRARLMRVAYWVSGPFPGATELIVAIDQFGGELTLTSIKDAEGYRWIHYGGLSTCPGDYRTTDGASVDQLIEDIELGLVWMLGDDDPRLVWEQLEDNVYRVPLPEAADLDRITQSKPPARDAGFAGVPSHVEALGRMRTVLDQLGASEELRSGDSAVGATAVIREISAVLTELELAAIAEQHLPRLEIVVNRDPDAGTPVAAFIDGVPHRAETTVVDPGVWRPLPHWRGTGRRLAAAASPLAAAQIRSWFASYDSTFSTR
jgi:hypothetical protein